MPEDLSQIATQDTQPVQSAATTADARFTQADLDRLIGETRKKARETAHSDVLKELGTEDLKTAAELVKRQRDKEESEKSETQKALDTAAKEKARADAKEQEFEAFKQQVASEKRTATRDNAIKAALTTAGGKADKVIRLLDADNLETVMREDGTVDEKKVSALVESARKLYPEDFTPTGRGTPSLAGGGIPQRKVDSKQVKTSGHL